MPASGVRREENAAEKRPQCRKKLEAAPGVEPGMEVLQS
jgi:hypothetical protein